jgi:hypothetical protein
MGNTFDLQRCNMHSLKRTLQVIRSIDWVYPAGICLQGDAPVIWRGPIVNNAIDKFLLGTKWGPLDVLVVDMPPGKLLVSGVRNYCRTIVHMYICLQPYKASRF